MAFEIIASVSSEREAEALQADIDVVASSVYPFGDGWDVQFLFNREATAERVHALLTNFRGDFRILGLEAIIDTGEAAAPDGPVPFPVAELWEAHKGDLREVYDPSGKLLFEMKLEELLQLDSAALTDPPTEGVPFPVAAYDDLRRHASSIAHWSAVFRSRSVWRDDAIALGGEDALEDGAHRLMAAVRVGIAEIYVKEYVPEGTGLTIEEEDGKDLPVNPLVGHAGKGESTLDQSRIARILGSTTEPAASGDPVAPQGMMEQYAAMKEAYPAAAVELAESAKRAETSSWVGAVSPGYAPNVEALRNAYSKPSIQSVTLPPGYCTVTSVEGAQEAVARTGPRRPGPFDIRSGGPGISCYEITDPEWDGDGSAPTLARVPLSPAKGSLQDAAARAENLALLLGLRLESPRSDGYGPPRAGEFEVTEEVEQGAIVRFLIHPVGRPDRIYATVGGAGEELRTEDMLRARHIADLLNLQGRMGDFAARGEERPDPIRKECDRIRAREWRREEDSLFGFNPDRRPVTFYLGILSRGDHDLYGPFGWAPDRDRNREELLRLNPGLGAEAIFLDIRVDAIGYVHMGRIASDGSPYEPPSIAPLKRGAVFSSWRPITDEEVQEIPAHELALVEVALPQATIFGADRGDKIFDSIVEILNPSEANPVIVEEDYRMVRVAEDGSVVFAVNVSRDPGDDDDEDDGEDEDDLDADMEDDEDYDDDGYDED